LKLTVLGWAAGISTPESPQAGYILRTESTTVLLECGSGVIGELQNHLEMTGFEAMILSHLHSDHVADVMELVVHRRYHPIWDEEGYERLLPTWAPAEAPERLAVAYAPSAADRANETLTDVFDFTTIVDGTEFQIGDIEVKAIETQHSVECYGFRFSAEGRTLGFTADSGPCDGVAEIARDVDLLLSEATWDHSRAGRSHMSGKEAGENAKSAGAKRLLLTHLESWTDTDKIIAEAREAYGDLEVCEVGRTYEV
jgi:ribonuclease BN (tRNA processing enzyme)